MSGLWKKAAGDFLRATLASFGFAALGVFLFHHKLDIGGGIFFAALVFLYLTLSGPAAAPARAWVMQRPWLAQAVVAGTLMTLVVLWLTMRPR